MYNAKLSKVIENLDNFIDFQVKYNHLYSGGCCWSAFCLASELEKRNIPYDVVSYSNYGEDDMPELEDICKSGELTHVGIVVDGKEIGSDEILINDVEEGYYSVNLHITNADELLNMYNTGNWNPRYDTGNNDFIRNKIMDIFSEMD